MTECPPLCSRSCQDRSACFNGGLRRDLRRGFPVVGSVGRSGEFDAGFMPTRASAGRWKRVDLAFRTGRDLPPVVLYKLGDDYYVHDGNHRVSVARFEGVEMIDAEVTEFFPSRRAKPSGDGV